MVGMTSSISTTGRVEKNFMLVIFLVRVEFHIHKWIVFVRMNKESSLKTLKGVPTPPMHDFEQLKRQCNPALEPHTLCI